MNLKSIAYSFLGAFIGIFLCALLGVNFSNGIETSNNQQTSTTLEVQPNVGLSDSTLQGAASKLNFQRQNAMLNSCQLDLINAKADAAQLRLNATR
jgi:hypothetical protein